MARLNAPPLAPLAPATAVPPVATLGSPHQQAFQRALQLLVGTRVPVQVLSRQADGSALVSVAGFTARMALPAAFAPGAGLFLTVAAAVPRPTFQLGLDPHGTPQMLHAEAAVARAGQASTLPGLPDGGAPDMPASLSPAAHLIGKALAQLSGPHELLAAAPLLADRDVSAPRLAAALRETIQTSGLFYESHVAEWTEGKRTIDSLRAEPQMQIEAHDEPAALRLIGQQLASHEQQEFAWQGQLAQGIPLEWRIGPDLPPSGSDTGPEAQTGESWHGSMKLQLPLLGEVQARISLHGTALQVRLETGDAEAAAALRAHGGSLASALAAAGLTMSGMAVVPPQAPE